MASRKKRTSWVVWLRRAIQTFFLFLFFYLFLQTAYHPFNITGGPVKFFFQLDPLVMVGTFLAHHAIPGILLLSVFTLVVTLLFGRWFCGWVCPFGVLHNFFTGLRKRKMKVLMEQGTYTSGQKIKYYILIVVLMASLFGVNAVGWMDPFSFFYRSMATAVYPAINWGLEAFFTGVYQADPHIGPLHATSITEPIYEPLRDNFLAVKQPVYLGGLLIGLLFILVVGLNFYKGRFWCRYLCPLGALLGIVGKNPLFRLTKKVEDCHNCRVCLTDCQGGAQPQTISEWKPSECFYCWNCSDACSTNAISFQFEFPLHEKQVAQPIIQAPPIQATLEPSQAISDQEEPVVVVAEKPTTPKSTQSVATKKTPPKTQSKGSSNKRRKK